MLYIIAIVLGVIVGILFKGRIGNILNFKFEKAWIIITAFLIQAGAQFLNFKGFTIVSRNVIIIQSIVIVLLLIGFWYNRKNLGITFLGIGLMLNAVVMIANGGKMPVSYDILKSFNQQEMIELLEAGRDSKHTIISENTNLAFLSDVIYIPYVFGYMMRLVSIGDLMIVAGIFILTVEIVSGKHLIR